MYRFQEKNVWALLEWVPFQGFPRDDLDAWVGLTQEERDLLLQRRAKGHAAATDQAAAHDSSEAASSAGSSNDPPLHMQESLTRAQVDKLTLAQKVERYGKYALPDTRSNKHRQQFFDQRNKVMKPHIKRWVNGYTVRKIGVIAL